MKALGSRYAVPDTYRGTTIRMTIIVILLSLLTGCGLDRSDPFDVAKAFTKALMRNDAERAKSLTTADQSDGIDMWIADQQAFTCSNLAWDTGAHVVGIYLDDHTLDLFISFLCDDPEMPYYISISDILLQQTEDEWLIVSWGEICEERDYGLHCP